MPKSKQTRFSRIAKEHFSGGEKAAGIRRSVGHYSSRMMA
jgi:hypothetical protein